MTPEGGHHRFALIAQRVVEFTGSGWAALVALGAALAWVAIGFPLGFSRGWELGMTVGMPVLTLVLLIVVQHTQNHDNLAMQLKLDELIRSIENSENTMMRVENASREDLDRLEREFEAEATEGKESLRSET